MKQTHPVLRRALAVAAGLVIGLGGAVALTTPAQATFDPVSPQAYVMKSYDCDGLKLKLRAKAPRSGNSFRVLDANGDLVWPEGVDVNDDDAVKTAGWINHNDYVYVYAGADTAFPLEVSYWSGSNPGGANWRSTEFAGEEWPKFFDWEPTAGLWPECGDSPQVRIIEDCDGNVTVEINGNDTRRTWRVDGVEKWIDVNEAETFEASASDTPVEWWHEASKEWKTADESYVTYVEAEDCPEPGKDPEPEESEEPEGEGGELPVTGSQTAIAGGAALALLALGGGLYMLARRRRITFQA